MKSRMIQIAGILSLTAIIIFAPGCSKDDDNTVKPAPNVTLSSSGTIASTGSTVQVPYSITSGDNLKQITFSKVVGTQKTDLTTKISGFDEATKDEDVFSYVVDVDNGTVSIRVQAEDTQGLTDYKDYVITLPSFNPALSNDNIPLTSNRADALEPNSYGSYYSIDSKTTGPSTLPGSDFKLLDKNTISSIFAAPDMYLSNFDAANAGLKFHVTSLDFDASSASLVYNAAAPDHDEVSISEGNVVLFQTAAGKRGLIKVQSLETATVDAGGTTKNAILKIKVLQQ